MTLRQISEHHHTKWREWLSVAARWLTVVLLLLLYLNAHGWAQGLKITGTTVLHVICDSGCSAGTGATGIQVRNAGDTAWVNAGFNVANLTLPVTLQTGSAAIGSITNTGFNVNNFPSGFNVNNAVAVTGTFWQATQPVSGTFWQATQPVSIASMPSTPVTGTFWQATQPVSGTFWQATQPVSIASMPSTPVTGTFWQATQPISGTVTANAGTGQFNVTCTAANCPVNVSQFGGTNVSTGTGAGGLGIPRVTISNDSSLAANQSVNVAQIAGATTSTAASGVQKVGITGNAGAAVDAANNAAAPANVVVDGFEAQSSALSASATAGNVRRAVAGLDGVLYVRIGSPLLWSCGLTAIGATLTQCQAAPAAGTSLYLTDITILSDTTTAGSYLLRQGTGTNCATGTATIFPAVASLTAGKLPYPANSATGAMFHQVNFQTPLKLTAANALCVICVATNTCTVSMQGFTAP